jgi:hypothetical protein
MGIKKISKRLAKVGRKASESLGGGGKKWVEAVFETASGGIEDELRKKVELGKKVAKPARTAAASPGVPPRRPAAPAARKVAAAPRKKRAKPAKKRTSMPPRRPSRPAAATRGGSGPVLASADPVVQSDHHEDESLP